MFYVFMRYLFSTNEEASVKCFPTYVRHLPTGIISFVFINIKTYFALHKNLKIETYIRW